MTIIYLCNYQESCETRGRNYFYYVPYKVNLFLKKVVSRIGDETYIGETIRNVDIRWNEHEDIGKESEPAKHLRENLNHKFKWETILQDPKNYRQRKNLEASFIDIMGPTLNNQFDTKKLYLFRNGGT